MKIKEHIPNIITSMNLLSGCIAIVMAFEKAFIWVVFWVLIAAVFDFFDGMTARVLNVPSKMGKELDSLADVVSFGVAPATAVFVWLQNYVIYPETFEVVRVFIPYFAFVIPVYSALRLAKFNIDERQTSSFIGLPTPANGVFWISYIYGISSIQGIQNYILLVITLVLIVILSLLMVSEIPMFSFKLKSFKLKGNEKPLILLISSIVLISILGVIGLSTTVLLYILISFVPSKRSKVSVK